MTSQQSQQLPHQETETRTQSTAGSYSQGSQRQSTDGFPTLQVPGKARIIMLDWSKSNPAESAAGTCTEHKTQPFLSNSVMRTAPGHELYPCRGHGNGGRKDLANPPTPLVFQPGLQPLDARACCPSQKHKNNTGNCIPNRGG